MATVSETEVRHTRGVLHSKLADNYLHALQLLLRVFLLIRLLRRGGVRVRPRRA